ncbi:Hypothetical protein SRAE_1000143250 [Strongyloides ratti]|uniref:Uncharacterized protein n=1 Tax=Strongyloides ratti TaxID=34506 RepID=A0A090MVW4_STRRB|nr:Hypothetical protein SRAE_1000143250 [Strongyloides ratti]CEF63168.1 Hypothetical protein SRAE_1000143250 [Strongyloides ratti]
MYLFFPPSTVITIKKSVLVNFIRKDNNYGETIFYIHRIFEYEIDNQQKIGRFSISQIKTFDKNNTLKYESSQQQITTILDVS